MKANSLAETVLKNLYRCGLTAREYAVFLAWFEDANGFNASQEIIAERTGIDRPDVCKILKSLVSKGVLQFVKKGQKGINYYILATKMTLPPGAKVDEVIYASANKPVVTEPTRPVVVAPQVTEPHVVLAPHSTVVVAPHIPQNNLIGRREGFSEEEKEAINAKVRVEIQEAIESNRAGYIAPFKSIIPGSVAQYGEIILFRSIEAGIERAFSRKESVITATRIARKIYEAEIDKIKSAHIKIEKPIPKPTQPEVLYDYDGERLPPMMPGADRLLAMFRDVTEEVHERVRQKELAQQTKKSGESDER